MWSANPRTLVQMIVQILGSGWGAEGKKGARDAVMATAVNAGMLALINAGSVPLKGVVCTVAVGRRLGDSVLVLDPGEEEEAGLSASGCFAFLFSNSDGAEGVVGR
jgi:exosome complex component RRP46